MLDKPDEKLRGALLHFNPKETKNMIERSKRTRSSQDINATLLVLSGNTPGRNERYTNRPHYLNICILCDLNAIDDGYHAITCPFNDPLWIKTNWDICTLLEEVQLNRIHEDKEANSQPYNDDELEEEQDKKDKASKTVGTLSRHRIKDKIKKEVKLKDWTRNDNYTHIHLENKFSEPIKKDTYNDWTRNYTNVAASTQNPPSFKDILNHAVLSYQCSCKKGMSTTRFRDQCSCREHILLTAPIINLLCTQLNIRAAAYSNPYAHNTHYDLWESRYPYDKWLGATHTHGSLDWTQRYTLVMPPTNQVVPAIEKIVDHFTNSKDDTPIRIVLTIPQTNQEEVNHLKKRI